MKRYVLLGFGNKEIAEIMNCTPQNISDVRNSGIFQQELMVLEVARDSQTVDVAQAIIKDAPRSFRTLQEIRDDPTSPDGLRAKICTDLLDRNPKTARVKSVQGQILHGHISEETLDRIKDRARLALEQAEDNNMVEAVIIEEDKE